MISVGKALTTPRRAYTLSRGAAEQSGLNRHINGNTLTFSGMICVMDSGLVQPNKGRTARRNKHPRSLRVWRDDQLVAQGVEDHGVAGVRHDEEKEESRAGSRR